MSNRLVRISLFAVLFVSICWPLILSQDVYAADNETMKSLGKRVRVYVASPYGFSESTREFRDKVLYAAIKEAGCEVIDPWRHNPPLPPPMELGRMNASDIEEADGLVAVLDGTDVDSGTASEIGYGAGKGKWIVGYRGDFRQSGENQKVVVNLQVEYFVRKNKGTIVTSREGTTVQETMKQLSTVLKHYCK